MGISASNIREAEERLKNTFEGVITDLQQATGIELITGPGGRAWVNVDGICVLRIKHVESVFVDTSNALSTDKRV